MGGPLLLGVEIGGTKLQLGLGRGDGRILSLSRAAVVPGAGAEGIRAQIAEAIDPLLGTLRARRADLRAVGVGFGGPVDARRGLVTTSNQIGGWSGFPLADWVRERLGVRLVSLHNDADTAALGEARFGAGISLSPIFFVTVGSGIGGGLVIDGRIYRGAGLGASEIGHVWAEDPDHSEHLGGRSLESIASGWSLGLSARRLVEQMIRERRDPGPLLRLAGGDPVRISAVEVARAAELGDPIALEAVLKPAVLAMAGALAHVVALVAPQRIILGGGVSMMRDDLWLLPIGRELNRRAFAPLRGSYELVQAALGEEVVVQGALALADDALRES
jgi:glucokinase